jgi:phospholipid/cholesterol/gamma-HCH transport system ATP-binding protein
MPGKPPASVIEVSHLTCGYDDKAILEDVTFSVAPGEIFFIIGGSGCGKSTLLRSMIGLLEPKSGNIAYFGRDFYEDEVAERRKVLKTFGVLYQSGALWSAMTLEENISLPLEEHTTLSPQERQEIVALKLGQVGLGGSEQKYPSELSGGMQKRAALARALALDPAIVFFDEPTSGLDPVSARSIDELILQVCESMGTTMVIVSHQLTSIFRLADRLIMLHPDEKGIIAEGEPIKVAKEVSDPRVHEFLHNE